MHISMQTKVQYPEYQGKIYVVPLTIFCVIKKQILIYKIIDIVALKKLPYTYVYCLYE